MPLRRCFISKSNGDYSTQIGLFLPQIAGEAVCPFSLLGCFSRCKAARRPVPRAMPAERWGRLRAAGPGPLRRPAPAPGPFAGRPRPRAPSPAFPGPGPLRRPPSAGHLPGWLRFGRLVVCCSLAIKGEITRYGKAG